MVTQGHDRRRRPDIPRDADMEEDGGGGWRRRLLEFGSVQTQGRRRGTVHDLESRTGATRCAVRRHRVRPFTAIITRNN